MALGVWFDHIASPQRGFVGTYDEEIALDYRHGVFDSYLDPAAFAG